MKIVLPEYVPSDLTEDMVGKSFSRRLPAQIKSALRTPQKISVSEHAEKYRIVTDGPHPGPWRRSYVPHSVKIMDAFCLPHVREIWFCGPEQAGKTSTMLCCLHWGAHVDPGDIFYLMPDEKTAKKIVRSKIIPMIKASKCLSTIVTGKEDDLALVQLKLGNGVKIFPAWANSPSSMATFPAKVVMIDECDKGHEMAGRETDRIRLGKKRLRLYGARGKLFVSSTPAQLFIWKGVQSCPQVWEWRVMCPECSQLERMDVTRIPDIDVMTVEDIEGGLAGVEYVCSHCGVPWDALMRESAIRRGQWWCVKGSDLSRPSRIGFHLRAFECIDVPLVEIAVAFLKSEKGDISDKIAWANGYECIDYEYEQGDKEADFILRLVDYSLPPQTCPDDPAYLAVIADTQKKGFWYKVAAFGWGDDLPVAIIDHGFVNDFDDLVRIQQTDYLTSLGKAYRPQSGWIDSGGGTDPDAIKHTRTVQVYQFCRNNPFWRPVKGRQRLEQAWNQTTLDFWPSSVGNKVPIPGGLRLYKINVTLWKDDIDRKLRIEPGEPGCIRLHSGTGEKYAAQLCAEYRTERGVWKCPKGKDNHQGDNFTYLMAAADIIGIRRWKKPEIEEGEQAKKGGVKVFSKGVQSL